MAGLVMPMAELYCGGEDASLDYGPIGAGVASVYSARCPGVTRPNEDAAALIPIDETRCILAVADGLGGQPAGGRASRLALDCVVNAAHAARDSAADLRDAVLNGFESANTAINALGVGAGTTLAVVEVQGRTIRPYHTGDSMILVIGQRGRLKLQTVSHSPIGYAVEAGIMDEREAIHHEDRHLISNLVGSADMRIEIGASLQLQPRDTLLLATDGLFDNLHVTEIVQCIRKGPLDKGTATLADSCMQRMHHATEGHPSKPDDVTFVAYRTAWKAGAGS